MTAEISKYRGHPVIKLTSKSGSKYPFVFGLKKAMLILEHIEDIKKFVENYEESEKEKV